MHAVSPSQRDLLRHAVTNALHLLSLAAKNFRIGLLLGPLASRAVLAPVRVVIEEAGCFRVLQHVLAFRN